MEFPVRARFKFSDPPSYLSAILVRPVVSWKLTHPQGNRRAGMASSLPVFAPQTNRNQHGEPQRHRRATVFTRRTSSQAGRPLSREARPPAFAARTCRRLHGNCQNVNAFSNYWCSNYWCGQLFSTYLLAPIRWLLAYFACNNAFHTSSAVSSFLPCR